MGDIDLPLSAFIGLDWALYVFALGFVAMRIYVHWFRGPGATSLSSSRNFYRNVSDGLVVAAWLAAGVLVSINTWKNQLRMKYLGQEGLYYGVPKELSAHLLMVSWVSLFSIYISLWLSKAAFIAFYYHLFSKLGRWTQIMKFFVTGFTFLTFVLHMLLLVFWCRPVNLNWDINGKLCSAVHDMDSVTISTFTNVGTDLLIIAIPLIALRKVEIRRSNVYVYMFVMLVGGLSIVAALVRYGALKAVWGQPKASVTHTIDVWAMVEIVTSLMAVCLPSVRVFMRAAKGSKGVERDEEKDTPLTAIKGISMSSYVSHNSTMDRESTLGSK